MDLSTISIEELRQEIDQRVTVEPLFIKDGKKYYDVPSYNKLLKQFDALGGAPMDFTPIEWNKNGSAKSVEPQHVVINLEAYISNRVRVIGGKEYHVVIDTRTIREADSGNVTLSYIPEFIIKKDAKYKEGYSVARSTVSKEDFLRHYTESFGIADALRILKIIDENGAKLSASESTIKLDI